MKQNLAIAVLALLTIANMLFHAPTVSAQNGTPSGGIYFAGPATGCKPTAAGQVGICFVTSSTGASQIWTSADGAAYAPLSTGASSFSQLSGQLSPAQLPLSFTCSDAISSFTMDGKGNASGSSANSNCK
jgi:hypothetical protein